MDNSNTKLIIIGNPDPIHIGAHFFNAAKTLGMSITFCDVRSTLSRNPLVNKLSWHFCEHRSPFQKRFGQNVLSLCHRIRPQWLLATGLAPLDKGILQAIGRSGVKRINYLTDDPWNPAHRASWVMQPLAAYDHIFSVRQANLSELEQLKGPKVHYLPFGYSSEIHYPEQPVTEDEKKQYLCDVVFIGGADRDRLPYIRELIKSGLNLHLYGGYWNRYSDTRQYWKGQANLEQTRKAVGVGKVNLCLVRRANRDDNSMRTFEIPAMGGCMLSEDTPGHRELFGDEGNATVYFRTVDEMIDKAKQLFENESERHRMASNAHRIITQGKHTYRDRLITILETVKKFDNQTA